jgi:hypothetical protein
MSDRNDRTWRANWMCCHKCDNRHVQVPASSDHLQYGGVSVETRPPMPTGELLARCFHALICRDEIHPVHSERLLAQPSAGKPAPGGPRRLCLGGSDVARPAAWWPAGARTWLIWRRSQSAGMAWSDVPGWSFCCTTGQCACLRPLIWTRQPVSISPRVSSTYQLAPYT